MDSCPSCGTARRPGAAFCGGCGAQLPAAPQAQPLGAPMPPAPPAQTQVTAAYPAAAPQYMPQQMYPVQQPPQYAAPSPYGALGVAPAGALAAMAAQGQLMSWNGRPLPPTFASRKVAAGILGILFGQFGVHKFVLGYVGSGIAMLAITLVSIPLTFIAIGFLGLGAMGIIGLIEGIMYLTKTDDEFIQRYGLNHRGWF
jgi:TM2 domain-containing membrane protein YozV